MCLVKVKPEREEEVTVPNRVVKRPAHNHQHTTTTIIEETRRPQYIEAPPPPPPVLEPRTVIAQYSPQSSIVSIHSREYSRERRHSPHATYRYVDARASAGRVRDDDYYENPRRSGSVIYVNPRHSTASYRSGRERVVVVDDYGRRREYYR